MNASEEGNVKVLDVEEYEGKEGIPTAGNPFANPYASVDAGNIESVQLIYGAKENTALNALPYFTITLTRISEEDPLSQDEGGYLYLPSEEMGEAGSTVPAIRFAIDKWNVQLSGAQEQDGKIIFFPADEEEGKEFIEKNDLKALLHEIFD